MLGKFDSSHDCHATLMGVLRIEYATNCAMSVKLMVVSGSCDFVSCFSQLFGVANAYIVLVRLDDLSQYVGEQAEERGLNERVK